MMTESNKDNDFYRASTIELTLKIIAAVGLDKVNDFIKLSESIKAYLVSGKLIESENSIEPKTPPQH